MRNKSANSRKIIPLKLKIESGVILDIGRIYIDTEVINELSFRMIDEGSDWDGKASFYRFAETSYCYHSYAYLYQILNLNDGGHGDTVDYYFVTVPKLYDHNGYKSEVTVDSEKIVAESQIHAYQQYTAKVIAIME